MFEQLLATGGKTIKRELEFNGELTAAEFITGAEWASLAGFSAGALSNTDTAWIMMTEKTGQVKIFPKLIIRTGATWNQYNSAGLVTGREIIIHGKRYLSRMISSHPNWNIADNPDDEWNRLMYAIGSGRPSDYTGPRLAGYTPTELSGGWIMTGTSMSASNFLSRGNPFTSGGSTPKTNTTYAVTRFKPLLELLD